MGLQKRFDIMFWIKLSGAISTLCAKDDPVHYYMVNNDLPAYTTTGGQTPASACPGRNLVKGSRFCVYASLERWNQNPNSC
jgi:hypothetical protein